MGLRSAVPRIALVGIATLFILSSSGWTAGLDFSVLITSLTAHNTSANPAYNQTNFADNFGTFTWVDQEGDTIPVDPTKTDMSLNPVTPGHVSHSDVHTLIPSRPDLRWFAHVVPWFGGHNHINIGVNNNSDAWVQAMVTDAKSRGFDGIVIDWYGQGSYEDQVTLRIQRYLTSLGDHHFKYIIMMDKGIPNLSLSVLEQQIRYCQGQYFNDPNYELEGGEPILMFFGVDGVLGSGAMAQAKQDTGGHMVWVTQGTSDLSDTWVDEAFDWVHDFHHGDDPNDPYNLNGVASFYSAMWRSNKKAFGSMEAGFNGMLTKSLQWSKGKYLPRGSGACVVQTANKINSVIPSNITRMQWATWNDWEEGSDIEAGVENDVAVTASISASMLRWTYTSGTGDESTIDHYEMFTSSDGVWAADLGSVPTGVGHFDLAQINGFLPNQPYQVYVDAVGKPAIRDHLSNAVTYTVAGSSNPLPVLLSIVPPGAIAGGSSFTLTATGLNFVPLSWVKWNGSNLTSTSLSSTTITATVPASDIAQVGVASVTVFSPAPGGGLSNALLFTILSGTGTSGGSPAQPTLTLPEFLPINATITAGYNGSDPVDHYQWTFAPQTQSSQKMSGTGLGVLGTGSSGDGSASFSTRGPVASLSTAQLVLGPYLVSVQAFDSNGNASAPAQAMTTIVSGDLSSVRVYPNPWRSDRGYPNTVTFDHLAVNTTIKIYTVSGHWVKTLPTSSNSTTWDLITDSGDRAASGIYLYLMETDSDQKSQGKFALIR